MSDEITTVIDVGGTKYLITTSEPEHPVELEPEVLLRVARRIKELGIAGDACLYATPIN